MKKHDYPMGSISHGTMRTEDLIPIFLSELYDLAKRYSVADHLRLCREIQHRIDTEPGYFDSEGASYDLNESLFNALNEHAAPYFYFGAHPGDGSDYGFWLCEFFEGDFDGLKVADLADVPKDYAGEILVVNDHGNVSLYAKSRTQKPREIWAVV